MPLWGVEMKLDTFAVPFTADRRMAYAAAYLEQCSYRQVEEVQAADFVLLPVPAKDYMLEGLDGKTVFLGGGSYPGTLDYCKNENFAEKNGILTAEGALWLAQNHLERALYRSRVLVCGYGRIGRVLSGLLLAHGADVTVCSRSALSKTQALFAGARHTDFSGLVQPGNYDLVYNTVPHMIFTKRELQALRRDTVLVDLASFPGGVELGVPVLGICYGCQLMAHTLGITVVDGRNLPGRTAPETAGALIGETVAEMIEEGLE